MIAEYPVSDTSCRDADVLEQFQRLKRAKTTFTASVTHLRSTLVLMVERDEQ
jgi:hypothetical protein